MAEEASTNSASIRSSNRRRLRNDVSRSELIGQGLCESVHRQIVSSAVRAPTLGSDHRTPALCLAQDVMAYEPEQADRSYGAVRALAWETGGSEHQTHQIISLVGFDRAVIPREVRLQAKDG